MKTFTIGTNDANQRFDKYLKKLLPNASVSFLYKMLRKKNITLDGKKATGKETLQKGAQVAVFFSDETLHKFMQDTKKLQEEFHMLQRLPMKGLSIIYEDTDILIADKPYNMLSQKAKEQDLSANEYLLGYLIRSGALSLETFGTFRPSVCNRLDRNTTGLLLMGKTLAGAQMLSEGLRERTIHKFYRAIVSGNVTKPVHLSGWLIKDEHTNQVKILTQEQKDYLWHGPRNKACIDSFFKMLEENQYKIQYRVMLARYRGKTICPVCHGTRLKKEAGYVKVGGKSISQLVDLPIHDLKEFFRTLELDAHDTAIAKRILTEITNRINFLMDVGLGYLTLNRLSNSLSGGESQRINLATSLGSSLVGSLYILDEPSIGLHSRDTDRLIKVLRQLQELGNTVVVVEHDEEIIRAADYIIDIGPQAGRLGGQIVYQGNMNDLQRNSNSYTVRYLLGEENIEIPRCHRPWNNYIEIKGARENNLKGIDVKFPLNVMTVVTGVSGSGKSTLVRDVFYKALKREYSEASERPGEFISLEGDVQLVKDIEFVDQNPIGKSSRSNPVTYVKAYDEIRKLFAEQPLAKQMGYTAGYFSFNTEGGRCEECKGDGTVTVEMQFMADLVLECESCHGKRFKSDTLEIKFQDKSIYDILEMTVNQAIEFFAEYNQKKIVKKLIPLQEVGLGYIKLGQASSTLSGGENQRVKLAYFLSIEKAQPTIFVFDEPTTGLHFHDIKKLLEAFEALISRGHTIIIIEHNMDVIKCADHVIDLGPEGGNMGGNLVVAGTPEEVAACAASYTGQFLREKLAMDSPD